MVEQPALLLLGQRGELGARRGRERLVATMSWALGRFEGARDRWTSSSFAAQTGFTPDSYPVVDLVAENVYAVLFRLARFGAGTLHPASSSPYP